jgi:RpiR family transcriptional regulator, carbohydrate utilization regulator
MPPGGSVVIKHADLLFRINEYLSSLSKAERKVAEVVLAEPQEVINSNITRISQQAAVSEPTVVRFCRSIGCDGFQDFKVQLAQSLVADVSYLDMNIKLEDDAVTYTHKVFDATINSLIKVRNQLDGDVIEQAVEALTNARKIEFYGFVASGAVAIDAQHKFFHFAVPCVAYTDLHMQLMSAAVLGEGDVVVAISHTGRTKELIESVRLARASGATVIGITAPESPLARLCSIVIGVEVPENTDVYMPAISRIAHLLVIDVLVVGVALGGGAQIAERLGRMKGVLQEWRLAENVAGEIGANQRKEGGNQHSETVSGQ